MAVIVAAKYVLPAELLGLFYWAAGLPLFVYSGIKFADFSALLFHFIPLAILGFSQIVWQKPDSPSWFWRSVAALLTLPFFYLEIPWLVIQLRHGIGFDAYLTEFDQNLWHISLTSIPGAYFQKHLAFGLEIVYAAFLLLQPLMLFVLYQQSKNNHQLSADNQAATQYYCFVIMLGFLLSYIGYLLVPVRGPHIFLASQYSAPIAALPAHQELRNFLRSLQGLHWDCFPSGHILITTLTTYLAYSLCRRLFYPLLGITLLIGISTIYLRYHYPSDLLAGLLLAVFVVWISQPLFRVLLNVSSCNRRSSFEKTAR